MLFLHIVARGRAAITGCAGTGPFHLLGSSINQTR